MQLEKENHKNFIREKAMELCYFLGNEIPDEIQLAVVEKLLYSWVIPITISFKNHLISREKTCLYYAAKGFDSEKTAYLMKVKKITIKKYRQNIFKKLNCKTMLEAVIKSGLVLKEMNMLV